MERTVASRIRALIVAGDYRPGDRLAETELAARLDVSRTPVREALRTLAADGLVELAPHRSARVVELADDELDHLFALRAQVEGTAAARAARRATSEQIAQLEELAEAIALYALPGPARDLDQVYGLNADFHLLLAAASGSSTIASTVGQLFHTAAAVRTLRGFDDDAVRRSVHHHFEIVAALRARDGEWAEAIMRCHLRNARAAVLGPLSSGAGDHGGATGQGSTDDRATGEGGTPMADTGSGQ